MIFAPDALDRSIITLLQEDGRMSCAEMARRLEPTSERTIRYRIDRLRRRGIVHVGAMVDPRAVGYQVTADVWIEVLSGRLREVAEELAAFPTVSYVAYSTGERDLSIQVYASNNEELHAFVTEVVGSVEGVTRTGIMLVPRKIKDAYQWNVPADSGWKEESAGPKGGP